MINYEAPKDVPVSVDNLIIRMNELSEQKAHLSTLDYILNSPDFNDLIARGEEVLPAIYADEQHFSHWHLMATQKIAAELDEEIVLSDEAQGHYRLAKQEVLAWLKARYEAQQEPEAVVEKAPPSGRILTQRAILAADTYWGIGYGDPLFGDPRASRRMEP
jgi:hypothetical protein